MLAYYQLDPQEHTSVKFQSEFDIFIEEKAEFEYVVCKIRQFYFGFNVWKATEKTEKKRYLTVPLIHVYTIVKVAIRLPF